MLAPRDGKPPAHRRAAGTTADSTPSAAWGAKASTAAAPAAAVCRHRCARFRCGLPLLRLLTCCGPCAGARSRKVPHHGSAAEARVALASAAALPPTAAATEEGVDHPAARGWMSVVLGRGSPVMGEVSGSPAATRGEPALEDEV